MKNSNDTIGNRSRDLPVCNAMPQPLRHLVPHRTFVMTAFLGLFELEFAGKTILRNVGNNLLVDGA
jgi:hypothetical protein